MRNSLVPTAQMVGIIVCAFFYAAEQRFLHPMQQLKQLVKRLFPRLIYRKQRSEQSRDELVAKVKAFNNQQHSPFWLAQHDIFTYHGEDGIIYYLLEQLGPVPPVFVDIGSGDCIKSNCAALATHFNWKGLFIDADASQLAVGKSFYKQKIKSGVGIKMRKEKITPENVNEILAKEGLTGEIGLLSIDIDGDDYWIWKAINTLQPSIVVVEAKVEFGNRDIIVPYGDVNHHSGDKMYNGASIEAFRKLGERKGYKLVGANVYGYNLFFVRKKENAVKEVATAEILNYPQVKDSFYPESFFLSHSFVTE